MTIDARWAVFTEDGAERGANLLVKGRDQVRELVELLADEAADVARLIHRDRPLWDTERGFFDHDVYATVRDGFGYFSCQDADRDKAYPEGDPLQKAASSTTMNSRPARACRSSGSPRCSSSSSPAPTDCPTARTSEHR